MTVLDIKQTVQLGGGVSIDSKSHSVLDLKQIAQLAKTSGANIIYRNASSMTALDMKQIAQLGAGQVIFEL